MLTFHQIQDRCLRQSTAYVGEEFTYKGTPYRGVIAEVKNDRDIVTGGYRVSTRLTIYVNKTEFSPAPQMGDIVWARGMEFFVKGYTADAISYVLELEDPHR